MARSTDKRKGKPLPSERGVKRQTYGRLIPGDDVEIVREIERIWSALTKTDGIANVTYTSVGSVTEIVTNITTGITGGTAGQVLTKNTGTDYDYSWATPSGGGGGVNGVWEGKYLVDGGGVDLIGQTNTTFTAFTSPTNLDQYVIADYDAMQAAGYTLQMDFYGYLGEGQILQMVPTLAGSPWNLCDTTGFEADYRTTMNGSSGFSNVDFGVQGGALTITIEYKGADASSRDYITTTWHLRHRWIADPNDPWISWVAGQDLDPRLTIGHFRTQYQGASSPQTANYTAMYIDDVITCDTSGGSFTVTLPTTATNEWNGKRFLIKKITSDVNTVTINPNASETLDGALTYVLRKDKESVVIWNDFGEWKVESAYPKKAGLTMNWQGATIPGATGTAGGVWIVPQVDGVDVTFNITQTRFRCETAPTTGPTTVVIEKSNGGGAFSASTVDTLTLGTGVYQDDNTPGGTITSGQVARVNFTALGAGAAVYTVELIGKEQ